MAPEQLIEDEQFDYRIDLWSLGAILCKLLTGHLPFYSKNFDILIEKITKTDINFSKDYWADVSLEARDLI